MSSALPVLDGPWFSREVVNEQLTRFHQENVHLILAANVWRLAGPERDLVVDTGMGIVPLRRELPELFSRDPVAFVSHWHMDHSGGAHEFPDVRVFQTGVPDLQSPPPESAVVTKEDLDSNAAGALLDYGITEPKSLIFARPSEDYDVERYRVEPVARPKGLSEGDRIDLGGGVEFTVVHLPGHTHDSAGLFNEKTGELFVGDVVYAPDGGPMIIDAVDGSIPDYLATFQKLKDLDAHIVYASHGTVFEGREMCALADSYSRKWAAG